MTPASPDPGVRVPDPGLVAATDDRVTLNPAHEPALPVAHQQDRKAAEETSPTGAKIHADQRGQIT
jgi:hypothetical protein